MAQTARRYRYEEDAPLGNDLAAAIGQLVQQWGHLEDNAAVLTAVLLRVDHHTFRSVAYHLPTMAKFDALAAVAREVISMRQQRATIVRICEDAKRKAAERNRIIHGSWYPMRNPKVARRYTYTARGELKQSNEQVSADRVAGFTAEVAKLRRRFNHALARHAFYRRSRPSEEPK
jgi:hypothetical protein